MSNVLKLYMDENDRLYCKNEIESNKEEYDVYKDDKLEIIIYENYKKKNRINDIKTLYERSGIQGLFCLNDELILIIIDKILNKGYIINNKENKEKIVYMQYMDTLYCANSIDILLQMTIRKVEPDLESICIKMILGAWSDSRNTGYKGIYYLNYGECLSFDGVCSFVDSIIQKKDNEDDARMIEICNKYLVTKFEYNELIDIENMYNYFLSYSGFEAMDITEYSRQVVKNKLIDIRNKYFAQTVKEEPQKGVVQWIKRKEVLEEKTNGNNAREAYKYIKKEWDKIKVNPYMKMLLTQYFFDSYLMREIEYETELTCKVYDLSKVCCETGVKKSL